MNNESTNTAGISRKIWGRLFIGILMVQAILELGLGVTLLIDFPTALESGFGITYSNELDILGLALGLYLLLLTALMILSSVWTLKSNHSGITIGVIIGIFLFVFGAATFLKFGDLQALMVDSLRGLLTIILGYMAGKELKKQHA